MTEYEWLACADLERMLAFLRDRDVSSRRQLRCFACACCRRIWHLIPDERSRRAVEMSEEYADGSARRLALVEARKAALELVQNSVTTAASFAATAAARPVLAPAWVALLARDASAQERTHTPGANHERAAQIGLLRDIFGNPFRPVIVDPAWRSWGDEKVVKLAHAAYSERELPRGHLDPARLAVLTDALEEAGCDHAELLGHLRGPEPHVRACFVVDLLMGKS